MGRQQDNSGVNSTVTDQRSSRNLLRSSLNAVFDRPKATSSTGSVRTPIADRINTSVNKFRETVKNVTRKLAEGPKAGSGNHLRTTWQTVGLSQRTRPRTACWGVRWCRGWPSRPWPGVGPANASCLSIGGLINLGDGNCTSSPFSFALGLGTQRDVIAEGLFTSAIAVGTNNVANAEGFLVAAIAIGLDNTSPIPGPPNSVADARGALSLAYIGGNRGQSLTFGNLALAAGQGDGYTTQAGGLLTDIGNVALNLGSNVQPDEPGAQDAVIAGDTGSPTSRSPSYFNLAANIGDDNNVQTQGLLNSVLNIIGNGNALASSGVFNNATNFFGDRNSIGAVNDPNTAPGVLQRIGGNVVFTGLGDDNTLDAGPGPLSILGALGVNNLNASQAGPGIDIRFPFSSPASNTFTNSDLAVRGTQASGAKPLLGFRPGANGADNRPKIASAAGSLRTPLADRISKSVKRISAPSTESPTSSRRVPMPARPPARTRSDGPLPGYAHTLTKPRGPLTHGGGGGP